MAERVHYSRSCASGRLGLTLIEVLIALVLIALLMSIMYSFLQQTLRVRAEAGRMSERTLIARQMLDRLATELQNTVGMERVGFPVEQRLQGGRREITFLTGRLPGAHQYRHYPEYEEPPPAQHDLTQLTYLLWVDPDQKTDDGEPLVGGIVRTEKRTLNQFLVEEDDPFDVRSELWSTELRYLEFRYFDGVEWDTEWDISNGNSLPQLIQITVGYEPVTDEEYRDVDLDSFPLEEHPLGDETIHPDRYSTIVRLPAADRFFGSRVQRVGQEFAEQFGVEGAPAR